MVDGSKALEIGRRVMETEIIALESMKGVLGQEFIAILREIENCRGKVFITGMGKSGHIAGKMAATMSSLGTSAVFLHPGEAMHGDLGMLSRDDMVIAVSYSGESEEIVRIIPSIRIIGAVLVGITSNAGSTLAKGSDLVQCLPDMEEACHLGLAPTASTTVVMAYGDALAVALSELKGFSRKQFGLYHPAGSLGKRLTFRVTDLMEPIQAEDCVQEGALLCEAAIRLSRMGTGLLPVTGAGGALLGVVTRDDIEHAVQEREDIYHKTISGIVHTFPVYVEADTMAYDALRIMSQYGICSLPVIKDERVAGIVTSERVLRSGICL